MKSTALELRLKGTITVFLTLTLTLVIAIILAAVASARDRSMRMRCENAMDMGLYSVFGEYNRELLDQFDLYFIDSGYGSENGGAYHTGERLKEYLQYNLNPSKGQYLSFSRDLFGLRAEDVQVTMESLATDDRGRVFKRQAIRYVKDRYGLSIIEGIDRTRKDYIQYGIEDYDPEKERNKVTKKFEKSADKVEDEDGEKVEYESPVEEIEETRSVFLDLLLGSLKVSGEKINTEGLYSSRSNRAGCGIVANTENLDGVTAELLFDFYIGDKFSSYANDKDRKGLKYEIEYIINGQGNDRANLEAVVARLLLVREAANCLYIMSNTNKREAAKKIAAVVSIILFAPELEEALTEIILFSWAFSESCVDIQTLLDGYKVPLMKDDKTWVLDSFLKALNYRAHIKDGGKKSSGLDYGAYMQIFLGLTGSDVKLTRSMDLIEKDIRGTEGNEGFRLDNCIEFIQAQADIKSSYGAEYETERYFGYMAMPGMEIMPGSSEGKQDHIPP